MKITRNPYFDFLRGVAILMVVGIHTYPQGHNLFSSFGDTFQLILINFLYCAVPLFLAISGYFIATKNLSSYSKCKQFWIKQITAVYIPCLIFSVPWMLIGCYSVFSEWGGYSWKALFKVIILFFTCGYSIYYFIALIIECYLLSPILVKHNNVKTLILIIILSFLSRIGIEYIRYKLGIELPYILRGSFPPLLVFYFFGIFLRKHSRNYSLWVPILLILIGLILGLIQMEYLRNHFHISGMGQKSGLYPFNIGIILLLLSSKFENSYRDNQINRMILFIGEISFGIYFTHVYIIELIKKFIPEQVNSWIIVWTLSIFVTIGIIMFIKKISPIYARKFLGYR